MTEQTMTIAIILIPAVMIALIGLRGMRDGAKAEAYRAEVDRAVADGTWKAAAEAKALRESLLTAHARAINFPTISDSTWRDLRRIDGIPKPGDRYPSPKVNAVASKVDVKHGMDGRASVRVEYIMIDPVTQPSDFHYDFEPRTITRTFKVTGLECDHAGNPAHAVYCGKCGRMMDNPMPMPPPAPGLTYSRR